MADCSQSEFEALCLAQLRELWTNYGAMSETWFDGGWAADAGPAVKALVQELLPTTAAFGGYGVSRNPVKWVGTESGLPTGPIWSTGATRQGDPNGTAYVPAGCDTVLMTPHTWFAIEGMGVRTLADMINSYHATVGNNCVMELGFATDRSGLIPDDQVQRAAELGAFIRGCYGTPLASTSRLTASDAILTLALTPPESVASTPATTTAVPAVPAVAAVAGAVAAEAAAAGAVAGVDRVMLQEDLSKGQRIRAYNVEIKVNGSSPWINFSSGTSVGHKRIDIIESGTALTLGPGAALRLVILGFVGGHPPVIRNFAAFSPCPHK